jgi:hypothetical protein
VLIVFARAIFSSIKKSAIHQPFVKDKQAAIMLFITWTGGQNISISPPKKKDWSQKKPGKMPLH